MAILISCDEKEATHVRIAETREEQLEAANVIPCKTYEITRDGKNGTTIENEDGAMLCDFALMLSVQWMRKT